MSKQNERFAPRKRSPQFGKPCFDWRCSPVSWLYLHSRVVWAEASNLTTENLALWFRNLQKPYFCESYLFQTYIHISMSLYLYDPIPLTSNSPIWPPVTRSSHKKAPLASKQLGSMVITPWSMAFHSWLVVKPYPSETSESVGAWWHSQYHGKVKKKKTWVPSHQWGEFHPPL